MTTDTQERTTSKRERPDEPADELAPGRQGMPAGRVLVVLLLGILLWGLLYAPELKRSSEAQPEGLRRTVSLAILDPVVWVENRVGLTRLIDNAAQALGRHPNEPVGGGSDVDPLPSVPEPGHTPGHPQRDTNIRVPTDAKPLRVVVVGDSLAQGIGSFAERVFKPSLVDVIKQGRISTGLARPDYFNWPAQMRLIVNRSRPDLTIVMLGENDAQSLVTPGGQLDAQIGTADFPPAYEQRVRSFARLATSEGGHVIWVGLPNPRDVRRWDFIERQNGAFQEVADQLPNVAFFDTWTTFSAANGGYTAYYHDGKHLTLVRADDGVHFNADGYTILMRLVAGFATQQFRLDPRTYEG
jgi:lysophospholipase L1-like esterase